MTSNARLDNYNAIQRRDDFLLGGADYWISKNPDLLNQYDELQAAVIDFRTRESALLQLAKKGYTAKEICDAFPEKIRGHLLKMSELILRPSQMLLRGSYFRQLLLAGRGFGKTESGARATHEAVTKLGYRYPLVIAPVNQDARQYVLEGPSGLIATTPQGFELDISCNYTRLRWINLATGKEIARGFIRSAQNIDRFRGNSTDFIWVDELCSIHAPNFWETLLAGARENTLRKIRGADGKVRFVPVEPKVFCTTTPLLSNPNLIEVLRDPNSIIVTGTSFENSSLSPEALERFRKSIESGSKFVRQEYLAEMIDLSGDALFSRKMIDLARMSNEEQVLSGRFSALTEGILRRIHNSRGGEVIISVDPAVTSKRSADESGILVLGREGISSEAQYYVLADLSIKAQPSVVSEIVGRAFKTFSAKTIIYESNQGGDFIREALKASLSTISHRCLKDYHVHQNKETRATAASVLYSEQRVHHVCVFPHLERQMLSWIPKESNCSPDRMDALSNGIGYLSARNYKTQGSGRRILSYC